MSSIIVLCQKLWPQELKDHDASKTILIEHNRGIKRPFRCKELELDTCNDKEWGPQTMWPFGTICLSPISTTCLNNHFQYAGWLITAHNGRPLKIHNNGIKEMFGWNENRKEREKGKEKRKKIFSSHVFERKHCILKWQL